MDSYHKDLWAHPDQVPNLDPHKARDVLSCLLDFACRAQHVRNIQLGREVLLAIPRDWLLAHIEAAAQPLMETNEDWEYKRLLELYERLDAALARGLAERGLSSPNQDIREAGQGFLATERN
jgi:hypothetical protein